MTWCILTKASFKTEDVVADNENGISNWLIGTELLSNYTLKK